MRNNVKQSYVYIMSNKKDGVLYVGVTSDLIKRVYEHKHGVCGGFTKKYNLVKLVHYELYDHIINHIPEIGCANSRMTSKTA